MMRKTLHPLFLAISCTLVAISASAESGPAITDPAAAGVDFALQGEYQGSVPLDQGEANYGVQVIALGESKFQIVGYLGGLPGAGWSRGMETKKTEAVAKDGQIEFTTDDANKAQVKIADDQITITVDGKTHATLKKVLRESSTLGAKAPADATVLFDSSSADQFENGKLVDGKWLGATNCASKLKLGDHQLHIEFRTPFMPAARGQGRGNSGVYMQGRYELQVLDSFGLEGENNECGGIYTIAKPVVNMCLPPLAWQTYDIDFKAAKYGDDGKKTQNARVTIKHNGVLIHDNLELPNGTPGRFPEGPGDEALFLQDHGNPVVFRNIWVVQ